MNAPRNHWLDQPGSANKIVYMVYAVSGLVLVADLFYHKHTHFHFEQWFGFFGFFGFTAGVALALVARLLRMVCSREEDYYDE